MQRGSIQFTPLLISWELPPFLPVAQWRWLNQSNSSSLLVTFNPLAPSTESALMGLRISMISLRDSQQTVSVLMYWRVVHWSKERWWLSWADWDSESPSYGASPTEPVWAWRRVSPSAGSPWTLTCRGTGDQPGTAGGRSSRTSSPAPPCSACRTRSRACGRRCQSTSACSPWWDNDSHGERNATVSVRTPGTRAEVTLSFSR